MKPACIRLNLVSRCAAATLPHAETPSEFFERVKNGYDWRRKQRWWAPGPTIYRTTGSSGLPNWQESLAFLPNPSQGPRRRSRTATTGAGSNDGGHLDQRSTGQPARLVCRTGKNLWPFSRILHRDRGGV